MADAKQILKDQRAMIAEQKLFMADMKILWDKHVEAAVNHPDDCDLCALHEEVHETNSELLDSYLRQYESARRGVYGR